MKLLIKNGHILNPATGLDEIQDILIKDGIIKEISKGIKYTDDSIDDMIDAKGKYVMPGFIDLHVHLREPGFEYKETIKTGSKAAARGGFTTICPMPNTNPVIDSKEMVEYINAKANTDSIVNIVPIGAVTRGQKGRKAAYIEDMVLAGAKAISEDGKSVMDVKTYVEAMKEAAKLAIPVFAHCEDRTLVGDGVINEGTKSLEFGLEGISNTVEDIIVARDILLAKKVGVKLHLCHCSTQDSVMLVENAKKENIDVTAEVCPHHFTLTDEEILRNHGDYKMNPPLRSLADVAALKQGLKEGIIDVIATDHAPHGEEENGKTFREAPFGIVGLETAFALTVTELVKPGYLTPLQMVEKLSYNPARILGIDKGTIEVGEVADIVIGDLKKEYKIDSSKFESKGKNTPFDGKKVFGKIIKTIVSGNVVYSAE